MNERYFFLLLGALYVGIFAVGSWLVSQPEWRQLWRTRLTGAFEASRSQLDSLNNKLASRVPRWVSRLNAGAQAGCQGFRRHKGAAAVTLALLVLPALLALWASRHAPLEAYVDEPKTVDPVISALLHGEHLVPPPPLPPDVFLTKELETLRPEIANASREWTLLDSDFRQRLLAVYRLMKDHGYQMALIEGYRSPERQTQLARMGPQVTNARAFQSYHQYGLAADSAFYRNGKIVISEKDTWATEGYRLYGKYAESVGLTWGGRWQMMDLGHVELRKSGLLDHRQRKSYQSSNYLLSFN